MNIGRYTWSVLYTDGSRMWQIDPRTGVKSAYENIDRTRLLAFEMWENDHRIIFMKFTPKQRLIWRRRVQFSPGGDVMEVAHIIGKQETVNGKNRQGLVILFESDGSIEGSGKFQSDHPWAFAPEIHKEEDYELDSI